MFCSLTLVEVVRVTQSETTRSPAIAKKSRPFEAQRLISSHWEKAICQRWHSSMHAMSTERCLESYNER